MFLPNDEVDIDNQLNQHVNVEKEIQIRYTAKQDMHVECIFDVWIASRYIN